LLGKTEKQVQRDQAEKDKEMRNSIRKWSEWSVENDIIKCSDSGCAYKSSSMK
jgi:hypothetical protein